MSEANPFPAIDASPQSTDFAKQFERRFRRAQNASADWRRQAREFYKAYGGDPWPDVARGIMDEEGRPVTSFNYALAHINAVLGQDIADRKEARFQAIGYEESDSFSAEVLTQAVRSLYMKCNAHREETEAFQDQLVTGYGWTSAFLDTAHFPVWPAISSVDCQEMYWDPDSKKHNLRDAKYIIRRRRWTLEDAIAMWPQKKSLLAKLATTKRDESNPFPKSAEFDGYRTSGGGMDDPGLREDGLWIYEYQFKKNEPWVVFRDPVTGAREKVSSEEFNKVSEMLLAEPGPEGMLPEKIDAAKLQLERVFTCFLAGSDSGGMELITEPLPLETEMFTYRCATGYRSRDKQGRTVFFGLMAVIYEPQLWTAKMLSASIEHISVSPKGGGGFINPEFLADPADFKENGSMAGHWAFVNSGFNPQEHVFERSAPPFPQTYEKLFDLAESAMPRLTTISDYFKGTAQQERSNVLVTNLQGQTMMVLNPLIDPMNQMRVENARLMALLAQQHISAEDFNRLVGELEAEGVTFEIAKDPATGQEIWQNGEPVKQPIFITGPDGQPMTDEMGQPIPVTPFDTIADRELLEFDVQVDLGPASPTQKQAIWQNWQQTAFAQKILEMYPEVAEQVLPWLVKNSPGLSTDEAKRMEKTLRTALRQRQMQGTAQGIMESLQQLPPEAIQQIIQMASSMLQQAQQPQQSQLPQ